jgi:alkylhydroperoxidase/carboxymuconolactone decarboxylase family protein YurZ
MRVGLLRGHLERASRNGLTGSELTEVVSHLARYGWRKAISAITVAKQVFGG